MCGSSKQPKVKPTPQEIQAAKHAVAKYNEFHQDGYVGLEESAIADSRVDHSSTFKGLASADLAMAEGTGYQQANMNRNALGFTDLGSAIGTSMGNVNAMSEQQGLQLMDARKVGAARTGQDMANMTAGAMTSRAADGLRSAITETEAQVQEEIARNQAISQVASTAANIYGDYRAKNPPGKTTSKVNLGGVQSSLTMDSDALLKQSMQRAPKYYGAYS